MSGKVGYFIFFLIMAGPLHGQDTAKVDSLTSLLQKTGDDTNKVNILNGLADEYALPNPQKSLEYSQQALKLGEKLNWKKGITWSYYSIGNAYENHDNHKLALEYRLKELKNWNELNDKRNICRTLANVGVSYDNLNNTLKALEYYFQSLKIAEEIGYKKPIINNQINIATIYMNQDDYEKASEYFYKSLNLAKEINYEKSISIIYLHLGRIHVQKENYARGIEFYLMALEINERQKHNRAKSMILANIASAFFSQCDSARKAGDNNLMKNLHAKSVDYYMKSNRVAFQLGDELIIAGNYGLMASHFLSVKNYNEAEDFFLKSLKLSAKLNAIDWVLNAHEGLYRVYKETNRQEKALEHYEKAVSINDSMLNENNKNTISELQIKFETEKKENKIKTLAQQNKIQELKITTIRYIAIGLTGLLVMVIIIGILLLRHNKLKSESVVAQFEQKLLRSRMNPHFIFNSLASIESFIYEHQPKEAGVYLARFSRLIRLILENSASEYITIEKEIETLNFYLSLEKLRLNDNLEYSIEADKSINPSEIYLPPMLTQPFIENAIEHGFRGIEQKGIINVLFRLKDHSLMVEVTDNGIGIEQAQQQKELHSHHKSLAMQITQERLRLLNKSKRKKFNFTVTDLLNSNGENKGTKIIFTIPLS